MIEYSAKELTAEGVKECIIHYKGFASEEEAKFDIVIVDNRPETEENYNEKQARESQKMKDKRSELFKRT